MRAPFSRAGRNTEEGRPTWGASSPLLSHSWSGADGTAQPFWSQLDERQWGLWSDPPAPWNPTAADLRLLPAIQQVGGGSPSAPGSPTNGSTACAAGPSVEAGGSPFSDGRV